MHLQWLQYRLRPAGDMVWHVPSSKPLLFHISFSFIPNKCWAEANLWFGWQQCSVSFWSKWVLRRCEPGSTWLACVPVHSSCTEQVSWWALLFRMISSSLQLVCTLANVATLVATKSSAFSVKFTTSKQGSVHLSPEHRAVFPSGNQPLTHACIIWWFNLPSILSVCIPAFHLLLGYVSASLIRKALLSARIYAQSDFEISSVGSETLFSWLYTCESWDLSCQVNVLSCRS